MPSVSISNKCSPLVEQSKVLKHSAAYCIWPQQGLRFRRFRKTSHAILGRDVHLVTALGCPVAAHSDQSGDLCATRRNVVVDVEDESPPGHTSSP
jgi:hypothetical protein